MTLRDRILQALSEGSSTVQQLAADLGETVADVKAEIRKIKDAWPPQIRVVGTWGELCRKAGIPLDGTPGNARIERLITGGNVITGAPGAKYERPCDTGPCGAPACGGGGCAFE